MRQNQKRRLVWILCATLFLSCAGVLMPSSGSVAKAAVLKTSYTLKKGKSVKIRKIVSEKNISKLDWESTNNKVVKVTGKKIKAVSKGTARVIGYDDEGNKAVRIKVRVTSPAKPKLIRTTMMGKVKGKRTASGKSMIWYGIPYGATTAGENRWREPQPVTPWDGVRNATKAKKKAIHYSSTNAKGYAGTQDCLYVNVYRPYNTDKNLPVLVYLHGGGNTGGTANIRFSSMAASMNVVIVSVSYRVGAFGFLSHSALQDGTDEENSGNFALLDIKQALTWVQNEIDVFGGNPSNVTLSGFSAGARNVLMCLLSPGMNGLFQKAFVISGGFTLSTPEEGEQSVESKLATILVNRGTCKSKSSAKKYISELSKDNIKQLLQGLTTAEVASMYKSFDLKMSDFPQGFMDGTVLPENGTTAIVSGNYNRVPILLGTDATEFSSFGWRGGLTSFDANWIASVNSALNIEDLIEKGITYGSQLQSCFYLEDTANAIYKDSNHEPIYAFRMEWGTKTSVVGDAFYSSFVGAYHGQTRDFLLGTYKHRMKAYSPNAVSSENKPGRQALTKQMRAFLLNFMESGNPNGDGLPGWSMWNSAKGVVKVMKFNAGKKKVTSAMSSEMYSKNKTFETMKSTLSETEYTALADTLFADRFFMPLNVPTYR
jgi:para-nitrobenzyl esterase